MQLSTPGLLPLILLHPGARGGAGENGLRLAATGRGQPASRRVQSGPGHHARRARGAARGSCTPSITAVCLLALTAGSGFAQERVASCTLEPIVEIGDLDGPNALSAVTSLVVSRDGQTVSFAQPQEHRVRVHSSTTGQFLMSLGRRGSGPGEYQAIHRLSLRHDTLVVADKLQQRLVFFGPQGDHLRTQQIASAPLAQTRRPAAGIAMTPEGGVWGESLLNINMVANQVVSTAPVVRLEVDGTLRHIVADLPVAGSFSAAAYGGSVSVFAQPLARWSLREIAQDGSALVVVRASPSGRDGQERSFTVTRLRSTADTVYHREFRYTGIQLSQAQRDSILRAYAVNFRRGTTAEQALRVAREFVAIPETQPPVSAIVVGNDGRVWLRREEISAPHLWLVLAPDGTIEGTCRIDRDMRILAATRDQLWAVRTGPLGVPSVVGFRLQPGQHR
jgi:hypothetical protein